MALFARLSGGRGQPPSEQGVSGERSTPLIARAPSLQSRISNLLAMALMLVIGAGVSGLVLHARGCPAGARASERPGQACKSARSPRCPCRRWAPITFAAERRRKIALRQGRLRHCRWCSRQRTPTAAPVVRPDRRSSVACQAPPSRLRAPPTMTPEAGIATVTGVDQSSAPQSVVPLPARLQAASQGSGPDPLSSLLTTETAAAARARILPAQRLLLPKGAFIDCTLETAIDSSLPGMTTCVTATDTFGADGKVVLLDRGTKLIGETRGQVQQGVARVFVLWTEARTPGGVVVPLDSPGADELGRSGLPRGGQSTLLAALWRRDPHLHHRRCSAGRRAIVQQGRR